MVGTKEILGLLATVIAFISYVPYFRDIFANKTKPHAFSWLVFTILTMIGFFGQVTDGAGPGAWVSGFTALVCSIITIMAVIKGKKNIVLLDWVSLTGAGLAILLWYLTRGPLLSVIMITLIDFLGFFPTIRKSYLYPDQETLMTYALSGVKYVISLFALENYTLVTALYPSYLILVNTAFVTFLILRRKQVTQLASQP